MCQLLGMNCNNPAEITFSFEGFSERGGRTDEHKDGWGIAFYHGSGCRLFTDYLSSITSPLAEMIKRNPIKSRNVIAHIRKATQGTIVLENSHPFMRELWGKYWTFAHNGDLKAFHPSLNGIFHPVGETDSERAFCYLMEGLRRRFPECSASKLPGRAELFDAIAALTQEIAAHGIFNFMLSNGEVLFAHCSTNLHYVVREYPFSTANLVDCNRSIDFSLHNTRDDKIAVIATKPLTSNEVWSAFQPGELKMFLEGGLARNAAIPVAFEVPAATESDVRAQIAATTEAPGRKREKPSLALHFAVAI
ncbi:class II glutamine amidotransferase [Undibacterium sp. TJN25]|uniref:class II glutamine amidotransferase n=1 Tax=Undibacterium sp. TJN25 TaxID=3413056 RepID=UPI003BF2981F